MEEFETVIGVEVHVELNTQTKIFCPCPVTFLAEPNTATCPICLGLPGVLPVLNESVVESALSTALALECSIHQDHIFERKNYYYPDLPKAYQITQRQLPIGHDGGIEFTVNDKVKRVGITDVHMEEDTGKSIHGNEAGYDYSLINYNRSGVPLIEIISEPHMNSIEEVEEYMITLRQMLDYLGVSDCRMELGQMRFEASVSLRPVGETVLGTRVEIKNLNSFRAVTGALRAEIERQRLLLGGKEPVRQATVLWNEARGITEIMRLKETADDYRYFPEPDLVPVSINEAWIEKCSQSMPEMPRVRCARFIEVLGLSTHVAALLTTGKDCADYFEDCLAVHNDCKIVSNWMTSDLQGLLNEAGKAWGECPVTPHHLGGLLDLLADGTISGRIAKQVLPEMFATGKDSESVVEEKGLIQVTDEGAFRKIIEALAAANPKSVEDYKSGNQKIVGFFVGQVMRETEGKANPQLVNSLVRDVLKQYGSE